MRNFSQAIEWVWNKWTNNYEVMVQEEFGSIGN